MILLQVRHNINTNTSSEEVYLLHKSRKDKFKSQIRRSGHADEHVPTLSVNWKVFRVTTSDIRQHDKQDVYH